MISIIFGALGAVTNGLVHGLEDRDKRLNGDHPKYSIVEIGQNTKKSPGDLKRLALTPMKNDQLTLL